MIGKHIEKSQDESSFRALNNYITGKSARKPEDRDEKIAYSDCINLFSVETATDEMEALAFMNNRCKDPVMHLLLSWRENENPTEAQVREAVEITLDEMNLSQCQALYSLHQNTDNLHLHICVNRIDPETKLTVTPARGWTRQAMEHAARRIEAAQGWQVEENAWSEVNEHGEIVQKPRSAETTISQAIRDKENLTGEQSAARKAQMALKDAVKSISSWDELHALMHENGMAYHKKGSGAVIQVGEVTVKASAVSRNFTLNKLEKKFGAYRPPQEGMKPDAAAIEKISSPQPLSSTNDDERWRAFIAARNEHFKNKKQIREELDMTQRRERRALKDNHREERAELFRSLGGRGLGRDHINRQSSLLAAKHAAETAELKQEHKIQRERQQRNFAALRSYENWLNSRGLSAEADAWRHRKNDAFLELHMPQGAAEQGKEPPSGILGFRAAATGQGVKFYSGEENQAAFVDMGKKIRVYRHDDDALLTALQLAQEKWGGVELHGSEGYKRRCVEISAKNGIRIANPELREMVAAEMENREIAIAIPDPAEERRALIGEAKRQGLVILTDAMAGRSYNGEITGLGMSYAVQKVDERRGVIHTLKNINTNASAGFIGKVEIAYDQEWRGSVIGRGEDSASLRNQRRAGRGR